MSAQRAPASGAALSVVLAFTLAEFAALVHIVDEGMWEVVSKPRREPDAALQDRVCQILGLPGYGDEDAVAGALTAKAMWPHDASDRVHSLMGQLAAKEMACQRLRESTRELVDALTALVDRDFTYFGGKVVGSSVAMQQAQISAARAALANAAGGLA